MAPVSAASQALVDKVRLEEAVGTILDCLHLPADDPNFKDTPKRVAKAYIEMCEAHLHPDRIQALLQVGFPSKYDGMLVVPDIRAIGLCPHHMLPVEYLISFGYIPGEKGGVIGLSKIPRFIKFLCRVPYLQEDLTRRIIETFSAYVDPLGCAVVVHGEHSCVRVRGVKEDVPTVTSHLTGPFLEKPATRSEFFQLINEAHNHNGKR